jgi:F-type H+-transporting ATPase subunit b
MITFALLIWFTMSFIWPPLLAAMEERKKKIADGLAAAERSQEEIRAAEERAKEVLKAAKEQSSELVTLAQKRANEIVEESRDLAKKDGERMIQAARSQIDQEMQQVKENLRAEVATLALDAAEQILGAEIDKTKHQEILNKASNRL